jgi:hypothetical protein
MDGHMKKCPCRNRSLARISWRLALIYACFQQLALRGGEPGTAAASPAQGSYSLFKPTPEADLRDFNPDRPSAFTGPFTVDPGHFQLEMDLVNYTLDRRGVVKIEQWNVAPFDLRVGLTSHTELDILYGGYVNSHTRIDLGHLGSFVSTQSGFGDTTLLLKYNLCGDDGGTFAFGILPYVKLPTNTASLGNKWVEGGVELPLSINLPLGLQAGLQTEFDILRNDADTRYAAGFTNIAYLGYTFWNKKLTTYVEWNSQIVAASDSALTGSVDTGLLYYIGKNAEVDFGCNFGVTGAAPQFEPFTGLTVRF